VGSELKAPSIPTHAETLLFVVETAGFREGIIKVPATIVQLFVVGFVRDLADTNPDQFWLWVVVTLPDEDEDPFIVKGKLMVFVKLSVFPDTVTVVDPIAAEELAVNVNIEVTALELLLDVDTVTLDGLKDAVTPAGSPVIDKATLPLKLLML